MILRLIKDSILREHPSAITGTVFYGINRDQDIPVHGDIVHEGEYSEFIRGDRGWLGIRIDGSVYGELIQ